MLFLALACQQRPTLYGGGWMELEVQSEEGLSFTARVEGSDAEVLERRSGCGEETPEESIAQLLATYDRGHDGWVLFPTMCVPPEDLDLPEPYAEASLTLWMECYWASPGENDARCGRRAIALRSDSGLFWVLEAAGGAPALEQVTMDSETEGWVDLPELIWRGSGDCTDCSHPAAMTLEWELDPKTRTMPYGFIDP